MLTVGLLTRDRVVEIVAAGEAMHSVVEAIIAECATAPFAAVQPERHGCRLWADSQLQAAG